MAFVLTKDKGQRMWGGKGKSISNQRGGGGSGAGGGGGISSSWVDDNYVSKDYFNQLFEVKVHIIETDTTADPQEVISDTTRVLAPNEVIVATSSATDPETGHTIVTTMALAGIQAKTGLWTNSYLSALGQNSGGGGGGGGSLNEPLSSINMAGLSAPGAAQDGQTVVWDNALGKWKYGAAAGGNYLPLSGGTMANTNLVTNMNADLLDGWHKDNLIASGYISCSLAYMESYWACVWDVTITEMQYNDMDLMFLAQSAYSDRRGIIHVRIRQNGANNSGNYDFYAYVKEVVGDIPLDRVRLYYNNTTGYCALWMNVYHQYGVYNVSLIKKTTRVSTDKDMIGSLKQVFFTETQTFPDSDYVQMTSVNIVNNVESASKLATSRTLWGQSFDGTANVSGNMTGVGTISANGNNVITKTTGDNALFMATNSNGSISLLTSTNRGVYDNSVSDWLIATNGTNTWLSRGNVGIGTTTPGYKLEVNGTLKATKFYLSSSIYFELDANNHVHLVGAGLYSDSFISALGLNSSGGGGGGSSTLAGLNDVSLGTLAANDVLTYDGNGHWVNTGKSTLLSGYATTSWVQSQGYLTASSLNGYLPLTGGTMANTNLVTNMNADMVDGLHDFSLFRKIANENRSINFADGNNKNGVIYINRDNDGGETTGFFGTYGSVLNISNSAANWQIGVGSNGVLKYRSRWWSGNPEGSDWTEWKEFAFVTSNVASATKLQTARTLWGQSFDGTANVSGSLSNTGHITSQTHKTYNIGTSTNMYNSIFGKWVGAGANEAFSLGANNDHAIYINTTQNVGIGKAAPAYKLDVNGNTFIGGILYLGQNYGIEAYNSAGLLVYKPASGWTGISNTQWGVGSNDAQGIIRSDNHDLLHRRNDSGVYTILTSYHHPSLSYTFIADTANAAKWHRLGNYKTAGDAQNFVIMLYSGSGYNANASQNSFARIVVKDGWQDTPDVGATNSVGITVERFGKFDSSHEIKVVAVATSNTEGELWVYLPWQYANGNYTISGVYSSWTHNDGKADDTTTTPTSNQRDTGYFDALYNTNIHGTITGNLVPSTDNTYTLGAVVETTNNGTTTYTDYFMKGVYTKRLYLSRTVYFELDGNGDVQLVGAGMWTNSFLSALGQNSSGGGGGGVGDVTWELLASNSDTRPISWSHIQAAVTAQNYVSSSALSGYATQTWVQQQGYLTGNALVGYATQTWVQQQGYLTSVAFSNLTSHPTTLSGYGITDAKIQNGTITLGSNSITPLTSVAFSNLTSHPTTLSGYGITDAKFGTQGTDSIPITLGSTTKSVLTDHQSLAGYATQTWVTNTALSGYATQSWVNSQGFIKSVSGTFWGRSWSNGGTISGSIYAGSGGGIIDGFHSIELNSNGSLSDYGGFIDFHYNGATGDYTSRIIEDASGRLYLDADNGVRIGNAVLKWDSTNNALYVQRSDGSAVNLYATGGISALGMSAGTSSVNAMTFNYVTINSRLTLPSSIVAGTSPTITRQSGDSDCVYLFFDNATSKISSYSYYYNQYDNVGLYGSDHNYNETWMIDPDGCARFKRLYLDATRYLEVSNGTLYYYNGSTNKQVAFTN